jgi:hypothetical protein
MEASMADERPQLTPEEEDFYTKSPTTVIYDIFSDTATRLGGKYVALSRKATTPEEREAWRAKLRDVEDQQRAVAAGDREALITHIKRWQAEVAELRGR